ncbi:putative RING finger domain and U-box domain [Spironucleus salmonicida]|uniref:RING finger domain and U-box domain n=2 Tax=Spironucleus TaxID=39709 RepID=V6LN26_9EUKA|nr:putative RING finger domain and U-box domain [Spironucleus salmonicida]|eukprot:EST46025.1 RING finger domain-containing protein [Spironucleus salmonicida]
MEQCSICFEALSSNISQLTCSHIFHKNCIQPWINENSSCPICRCPVSFNTLQVSYLRSFNHEVKQFKIFQHNYIIQTDSNLIINLNCHSFQVSMSSVFSINSSFAIISRGSTLEILTKDNTTIIACPSQLQFQQEVFDLQIKFLVLQELDFFAISAAKMFHCNYYGKILQVYNLNSAILSVKLPYILTVKELSTRHKNGFKFLFQNNCYIDFDYYGEYFVYLNNKYDVLLINNQKIIFQIHIPIVKAVYVGAEKCAVFTGINVILLSLEGLNLGQIICQDAQKQGDVLYVSNDNQISRLLI